MFELFRFKNSHYFMQVFKRKYFKSLFLISSYLNQTYDCEMSLFFVRNNVHFNFRTEKDIFDYFETCSRLTIKNSTDLNKRKYTVNSVVLIASNPIFIFFLLIIVLILLTDFCLILKKPSFFDKSEKNAHEWIIPNLFFK